MTPHDVPRRTFLGATAAALPLLNGTVRGGSPAPSLRARGRATRDHEVRVIASANGRPATARAYELIQQGTDTLDAVVAGVALVENDPRDTSVGYGGLPNERCVVELDAAVMHGPTHRGGAVAALQNIKNPAQVALRVAQQTDHVLLVGRGAQEFARAHGFPEENLLTDRARRIWLHWKQNLSDRDDWLPPPETPPDVSAFFREHSMPVRLAGGRTAYRFRRPTGTIHCSAVNANGDISCVTTTSGLAFKIPGRVGDSPILGAGLYCDNNVGSCGSTGRGEANLQNLCSFAGVELMQNGMSPAEAGLEICRRVASHTHRPDLLQPDGRPNFDLKFYLQDNQGRYAGASLYGPARFAVTDAEGTRLEECVFLYEREA